MRLNRDAVIAGEEFGTGASKIVRRGTLQGLEVAIAMIKEDTTDPNFRHFQKKFLEEAQLTARFSHPNIVAVYGQVGTLKEKVWIVYESCPKGSLQDFEYPDTGRLFVESLSVSI